MIAHVSGKPYQILLVEDETATRRAIRTMLIEAGFEVRDAANPLEALEILRNRKVPFDALLTDLMMPNMQGLDLAGEAQILQPGLKVLYMTGNAHSVMAASLQASSALLPKPFGPRELIERIRELLEQP